jgi:hypothetical protein
MPANISISAEHSLGKSEALAYMRRLFIRKLCGGGDWSRDTLKFHFFLVGLRIDGLLVVFDNHVQAVAIPPHGGLLLRQAIVSSLTAVLKEVLAGRAGLRTSPCELCDKFPCIDKERFCWVCKRRLVNEMTVSGYLSMSDVDDESESDEDAVC